MPAKNILSVIYEDDSLLAVGKPPTMASVPDPYHPLAQTVMGKVRRQHGEGLYLLHRLDRETSGLLLFGKNSADRAALESIFKHPATQKRYLTLVKGIPRGHEINFPLAARTTDRTVPALTTFFVLQKIMLDRQPCSLVLATIKTGRRHQIRQHFAAIHCPVLMDRIYGDLRLNRLFGRMFQFGRLFLHAYSLQFIHPLTQKTVSITAPLTADLQSVMKKLCGAGFLKELNIKLYDRFSGENHG